jgi:hypothetical protein
MAHLVKLIQARTLHLQRIVNSNPYETPPGAGLDSAEVVAMVQRIENLENNSNNGNTGTSSSGDAVMNGKQSAQITTEVRRHIQPDLDALNRAVRRYEKRATLQTMQTEARLADLEARMGDAIALAAAAAKNGEKATVGSILVEWLGIALMLPMQLLGTIISLPWKTMVSIVSMVRSFTRRPSVSDRPRKSVNSGYSSREKALRRGIK